MRRVTPKECKDLICGHPHCAHGRPHCPVCPAPGVRRAVRSQRCAGCNGGTAVQGGNVCKSCRDRGVETDRLFGAVS